MINPHSRKLKLILLAIGLGLLYWIFDSALMAFVFREGDFPTQLFRPAAHELWQRLILFGILFGFALYTDFLLTKQKLVDDALRYNEEKYRLLVENPERKLVEETIRQRNKELSALNAIAASVSQSLDLDQILNDSLDQVLQLDFLGKEAFGMLFLVEEKSGTLLLGAHRGAPEEHPCLGKQPTLGECLCGLAAQQGEVVISNNCWEDVRHSRRWPHMPAHKDICLPLKARGRVLGTLDVRLPATYEIGDSDIEILKSVSGQIGVAIENARLREHREQAIVQERERIARELHDGLSQLLGYVNTKAMGIRLMLKNRQIKEANENLIQLEEAARELFIDVRAAILGLKMAGQSGKGLTGNLTEYTSQFTRLSGLPVAISISPEIECISLDIDVELQLTRIVQEALINVRKHAQATQAEVNLSKNKSFLELNIVDNGIGFMKADHPGDNVPRFGLTTMRERAESIRAEFDLVSIPDHGTKVSVRLPIREG